LISKEENPFSSFLYQTYSFVSDEQLLKSDFDLMYNNGFESKFGSSISNNFLLHCNFKFADCQNDELEDEFNKINKEVTMS
jgi:hypothetical protein